MIYFLNFFFGGGSQLFQSMRGLGMPCSRTFGLVCEVALSFVTPNMGEGEGQTGGGRRLETLVTIVEPR